MISLALGGPLVASDCVLLAALLSFLPFRRSSGRAYTSQMCISHPLYHLSPDTKR